LHAGHISRVRLATERLRACRLAPAAASGKKVPEAYRQICFRVLRYMTNARRCCFPLILWRVHGQIFDVRASCIGVLASCPPPFRRRTRQRSARHALGRGRRREGGSEGGALNRGAASACAHTTQYVGGDGHFEHHGAFHHDNAQFAFLSEVWIWKPSHEIPIAAVAVSAMRPDALGR
jgi:hypothetical protein